MINNYQKQWEFLKNKFKFIQLGHAYLLSGKDTESIQSFAKDFVKYVNCNEINKSCGGCYNCNMIERESFPDLIVVKSQQSDSSLKNEKDMMNIEIEQIREVQNFLALKSFYGSFKAVIIEHSERMTREAQNCFLKNLEEPKGKTLILLISSMPEMLLPTIASRCEEIKFLGQNNETVELPKELSNIIHLDLAEKFKYVKNTNLDDDNFHRVLNGLQRYFRNLLLVKIGVIKGEVHHYSALKLKKIIELIENISYQSNTGNINNKLALEIVLIELQTL